MLRLYVAGQKIEWAETAKKFSDPAVQGKPIELRDDSGKVVGRIKIEFAENDPDRAKAITPEEIERRMAEPFFTLEEAKKLMGWE